MKQNNTACGVLPIMENKKDSTCNRNSFTDIQTKEKAAKIFFLVSACISILAVALICIFLFAYGLPAINEIGITNFLFGKKWKPGIDVYGIYPMILGSLYVTFIAIISGVPVGVFTAVFLVKFCPKKLYKILKPLINLMAGIPSVVYGFWGMVVLVPFIRETFDGTGNSILTASLLLGIMILPTIISVCESSLRTVPDSYYEGALALGATKEQSTFFVVLPAAKSGIIAGIILGIGRAIGETMAVIMVAGNQARMPNGILKGIRTLTANIVIEMGYAVDLHKDALIATGVILFIFIMIINLLFSLIKLKRNT